ncbi:MAG: hypothetical protein ACI4RA_04955 [Kiritimatiellia bacterium]
MKLHVSFRFSATERIPVGILSDMGRDTAFEYDPSFLVRGLNPAPFRLPLRSGVQVYDRAGNMATFAPFYDFTYSEGPNGWQTLSVAGAGENPTQADLDRLAREVGL